MEKQHNYVGKGNSMAIFAYLWVLIIIPFLTDAKDDSFVKFHLRQGLVLIVFDVIGWVANWFLWVLPVIGWPIIWLWWLASLVFVIIGVINVLQGHEKELPFIGKYAENFKI